MHEEKPLTVNPLTFDELLELKIKGNQAQLEQHSLESSIYKKDTPKDYSDL